MQYSEGSVGRVFAIRLEHGERMPEALERFAAEQGVSCGLAIMVGGVEAGSQVVVGPEDGAALPVSPVIRAIAGVHEAAAVGTLFPDETGKPVLHMHAALGREGETTTGCIRAGIVTWQVLEILLVEIVGLDAIRVHDPKTGFSLLHCSPQGENPCPPRSPSSS